MPESVLESSDRLRLLHDLELLDREPLESFDRLTELTSELLDIPVVLVSLVDRDRQFFQSCVGLPEPYASRRETPLSHSFCKHVVETGEPLVIEDARKHPLVKDNLAIRDLDVIAYLGLPLVLDGQRLGSFCAIDSQPRRWTEDEIRRMTALAQSVLAELTLRYELRAREKVEQELRLSERRFRALVEQSPDWIWETDTEGRFTYVSPAAESLMDQAADAIRGRTTFDFMDEEEAERFGAEIEHYMANELPFPALGKTLRRADGSSVQLETSGRPVRDDEGRLIGYQGIARDVTIRKELEEQERRLAAAEERRRSAETTRKRTAEILERMGDGFIAVSTRGQAVYANGAARSILGLETDRPVEEVDDALSAFRGTALEHVLLHGLESGRTVLFDEWCGGGRLRLKGRVVGREDGLSIYFTDLTKEAEAEKAFEDTRRQLLRAQKMEAVGLLAGGVAHDFNNVLATIQVNAGIALDIVEHDDPAAEEIREILSAARRAGALTRQLLAFSRNDQGQPRPVSAARVVQEMEKMLKRLTPSTVSLEVDVGSHPAGVLMDPGHLEQVVMNLVVNARDAIADRGTIRVRVQGGDDVSVIEVADDGCGMDEETRERVFEPLFTTKVEGRGTGLGLFTLHGIVERAGGEVRLESRAGEGTTFRILLPAREVDTEEEAAAPEARPQESNGTELVLAVDDNPSVLKAVTKILDRSGFRVETARDGKQALEWFEESEDVPALVISDVMMPRMTGPEFVRRLSERGVHVPVLFTSGYQESEMEDGGLGELPVVTHTLEKPFTVTELMDRVWATLDRGS